MRWSWHVLRRNELGQNLRGVGSFGNRGDSIEDALEEAFSKVREDLQRDTHLNRKSKIKIDIELDLTGDRT